MHAYILRRLLLLLPTAVGMVVITFSLLLLIPGDPAAVLLGQEASAADVANLRSTLGLDLPWGTQLVRYFSALLHGDMGRSLFQNEAVSVIIGARIGATLELAVAALIISVLIGVPLGVLAAMRQGTKVDTGLMLLAQLGVSMPVYWLGILLMLAFSVKLGWLPAIGRGEPLGAAMWAAMSGRPAVLLDSLSHLLLPAFVLGANSAAIISRLVRTSMIEILQEDFVRTAYAKGLRRSRVMVRHALRNALLPVISVIGLRFGLLLGGAVLTESIFGWPGLGQLTIAAISQRDLPLIQGVTLCFAVMFALVNLAVDVSYSLVDPRVRVA